MAATKGGTLELTPSVTSVTAGSYVEVTVGFSAATGGATSLNNAGIVVQWDKSVFALDASSNTNTASGGAVAGDNDAHGMNYLPGANSNLSTAKSNDENGRITMIWSGTFVKSGKTYIDGMGASDTMQIRDADQDSTTEKAQVEKGQAYINYTHLSSDITNPDGGATALAGYQFFKLKLLAKTTAAAGSSTIKAKFIANSVVDSAGSAASDYTAATKAITVAAAPVPTITVTGGTQQVVAGAAITTPLSVTLATGSTADASKTVTFSGTGVTFSNNQNSIDVVTGTDGVASINAVTLPTTVGTYTITAASTGYTSKTIILTVVAGTASKVTALSGTGQNGTVNTDLANPFTVTVTDAFNNAVGAGVTVNYTVTGGGGTLSAAAVQTAANGQASATLKLGTVAGDQNNVVTAAVANGTASAEFKATANPGAVTQLVLSVNKTSVTATVATDVTLTAKLVDTLGNTVTTAPATAVTFTISPTTLGTLGTATVNTTNGVATTTLTTAQQASGGTTTLNLTVDASTATITADKVEDKIVGLIFNTLAKTDGADQNGAVGSALAKPFKVTLTEGTTLKSGVTVTFTATGGTFANGNTTTTAVTDATGVATSSAFTLGTKSGTFKVTASATNYPSQDFALTANPGDAAKLVKNSGDAQTGTVGAPLANAFSVTVLDANDNPVSGKAVKFTPSTGSGQMNATSVNTGTTGIAEATLTLGTTVGAKSVTAEVTGITSTLTFTATANHGPVGKLVLSSSASTVSSYSASPVTITGTLQDQYGNTATSDSATQVTFFTVNASTNGYFGATNTTTQAAANKGVATATLTTVQKPQTDNATYTIVVDGNTSTINASTVDNLTLTMAPFSLNATTVNLVSGDSMTFTATGGTTATVWEKGTGSGATVTGSPAASVTYKAATVTATTTDTLKASDTIGGSAVSSTANITIQPELGIFPTSAPAALPLGGQAQVTLSGGNGTYECSSSNTAVATATISNKVCTVNTVATGNFTLTFKDTATYLGSKTTNAKTSTAIEVVHPITITSAKNTDGKVYLNTDTNKTYAITATGGKTDSYTYKSSNTAVATVSAAGLVTAVATGNTVITLTSVSYPDITQTLTVVVTGPISLKDTTSNAAEITTTQTTLSGGSGYTFQVAGGSTNYQVTVTGPGTGQIVAGENGKYTFKAPTTGAFAGEYTITVADTMVTGATKTITVAVPYKITASETTLLSTDKTQSVVVTGGAVGDIFKLSVLDGSGAADTSSKIAGLTATAGGSGSAATLSATAVAGTTNNSATGYIAPATLTTVTIMKVKAVLQVSNADSAKSWASVTSDAISIIPMVTYTLTVNDSAGAVVTGAKVTLRNKSAIESDAGIPTITIATTDTSGKTTVSLPAGGNYVFDVIPTDLTKLQSGTVTIGSTATTATLALRKISSPKKYTGTIVDNRTDKTKSASVVMWDANGNKVEGAVDGLSFTLWVDTTTFTPSFVNVMAPAGIMATRPVTDATDSCVNASDVLQETPKTQSACVAAAATNVWKGAFGSTNTFIINAVPVSLDTTASDALKTATNNNTATDLSTVTSTGTSSTGETIKPLTITALPLTTVKTAIPNANTVEAASVPHGTDTSTSSATGTLNVTGNDPIILVVKNLAGEIISAPLVHQPLNTTQSALLQGGLVEGTPVPLVADSSGSQTSVNVSSGGTLTTLTNVQIGVSSASFGKNQVGQIFTSARAGKVDSTKASDTLKSQTSLTGGEVLELDIVVFDANKKVVSTGTGNNTISSSGIQVGIPVNVTAMLNKMGLGTMNIDAVNSQLQILTAPTMQDFLAGKNITVMTGAKFDPLTNTVVFNTNHFSVFVPGVASVGSGSSSGGGGCFIATAAYGSYEAPYVKLLREFRDQYLLTNATGSWFVDQYYTYSPAAADWLREHDSMKAVVRVLLLPLIGMSWMLLHGSMPMTFLVLALLIGVLVTVRGWRRKRLAKVC
ncbi:MAG: hypothetical protein HQL95_01440 [Magnetococcales bacterium]|nr:hypothetical protein [Magnetococcales bacterium]